MRALNYGRNLAGFFARGARWRNCDVLHGRLIVIPDGTAKEEAYYFVMVQSTKDRHHVFVTRRLNWSGFTTKHWSIMCTSWIPQEWLAAANETTVSWTAEWQKISGGSKTRTWNKGNNDKCQHDNRRLQTFAHYDITHVFVVTHIWHHYVRWCSYLAMANNPLMILESRSGSWPS